MFDNITKFTSHKDAIYAISGNNVLKLNEKTMKWKTHDSYKRKILDIQSIGNILLIAVDEPWYSKLWRWHKYRNVYWESL